MPRWKKRIIVTWTTWGQLLVEEDVLAAARRRSLNLNNTAAIFSPIQHPSIFYLDTSETIVHTRPHLRSVQSHQVTKRMSMDCGRSKREHVHSGPSLMSSLTHGAPSKPPLRFSLMCINELVEKLEEQAWSTSGGSRAGMFKVKGGDKSDRPYSSWVLLPWVSMLLG